MHYQLQIEYNLNIFYPFFRNINSEEEQAIMHGAPMRALELMASCGQDKLLAHPVCASLLERKW